MAPSPFHSNAKYRVSCHPDLPASLPAVAPRWKTKKIKFKKQIKNEWINKQINQRKYPDIWHYRPLRLNLSCCLHDESISLVPCLGTTNLGILRCQARLANCLHCEEIVQ